MDRSNDSSLNVFRQNRDFTSEPTAAVLMPDGTPSWLQPKSDGYKNWNGYCGETSLSNIELMYTGLYYPPGYVSKYCTDLTPGNVSSTLSNCLNQYKRVGQWEVIMEPNPDSALLALKSNVVDNGAIEFTSPKDPTKVMKRSPVPVLVEWEGEYHWITVVDITGRKPTDKIRFNHWGRQDELTVGEFVRRWNYEGLLGKAINAVGHRHVFLKLRQPPPDGVVTPFQLIRPQFVPNVSEGDVSILGVECQFGDTQEPFQLITGLWYDVDDKGIEFKFAKYAMGGLKSWSPEKVVLAPRQTHAGVEFDNLAETLSSKSAQRIDRITLRTLLHASSRHYMNSKNEWAVTHCRFREQ